MYHILLNPVAGKRQAVKNLKIVERVLNERAVPYTVHSSAAPRGTEELARKLTIEGAEEFIVIGGDGTIHEALNGFVDPSKCRMGVIPSGTGNDFAERAGLSFDAKTALLRILDGEAKPTDYLEVGGIRCMNVAGFGINVDVLERCRRGKLKGKPKYLLSLIQSLFRFKGIALTMQADGEEKQYRAMIAAVCNGTQFGGGIRICPTAEIDDGQLNVVVVDDIQGVRKLLGAFISLMKGKVLEHPKTRHFLCERVRFRPKLPCTVQLDGELYEDLDFDVTLRTGLLIYR